MSLTIPPKAIREYHATLAELRGHGVSNELGLRRAFAALLVAVGGRAGWTLHEERPQANGARPDGTLVDGNHFERGYWEATDTKDDLDTEIHKKTERGYPRRNTIFGDGTRAVLYQDDQRAEDFDLTSETAVTALLRRFFSHTSAEIEGFAKAVDEFTARIPDLAASIMAGVETERRDNKRFVQRFAEFHQLCRDSVDPNIDAAAIEEMLRVAIPVHPRSLEWQARLALRHRIRWQHEPKAAILGILARQFDAEPAAPKALGNPTGCVAA